MPWAYAHVLLCEGVGVKLPCPLYKKSPFFKFSLKIIIINHLVMPFPPWALSMDKLLADREV
jgi:hypothetical protein